MFVTDESFNILSMAIIGGMGTIAGPLVGALLINIVTEAFPLPVGIPYGRICS